MRALGGVVLLVAGGCGFSRTLGATTADDSPPIDGAVIDGVQPIDGVGPIDGTPPADVAPPEICPRGSPSLALCMTFDDVPSFTESGSVSTTFVTAGSLTSTSGRASTPALLVDNSSVLVAVPNATVAVAAVEVLVALANEPANAARMSLLDTSAAPSLAMFYWKDVPADPSLMPPEPAHPGYHVSCALGASRRLFTPDDAALGNTWHEIACQCATDGTLSIYIDGAVKATESGCTAGQWDATNGLAIGQDGKGMQMVESNAKWNGKFDGLRVWTAPVPDAQLKNPVW